MIGALVIGLILCIALAHHLGARRSRPAEGFLLGLGLGPIGVLLALRLAPGDPARPAPRGLLGRFLRWLTALLEPRTAGMDEATPRARIAVYLAMVGLLALQVVARYKLDFLPGREWQLVHILIGWALMGLVLVLAHGGAILRKVGRRTWVMLGLGALLLTLFWYFGRSDSYRELFGNPPADLESWWPLVPFAYFAIGAVVYRMLVPLVLARLAFGLSPRALGVPIGRIPDAPGAPHLRGIGWIYLIAFLAILPGLVLASGGHDYLAKYPLCRDIIGPERGIWVGHFVVYEALYALVFISGESFWRGYLTFGMERDLGLYGLALMLVPYVTGHFGKPFSETLGAIVAGSLLGFLALKHRSVWFGVALHYGVALTMDLLAVGGNGFVIWS